MIILIATLHIYICSVTLKVLLTSGSGWRLVDSVPVVALWSAQIVNVLKLM